MSRKLSDHSYELTNPTVWGTRKVLFTVFPEQCSSLRQAAPEHVTSNYGFFCWFEYSPSRYIFVETTAQWAKIRNSFLIFTEMVPPSEEDNCLIRYVFDPLPVHPLNPEEQAQIQAFWHDAQDSPMPCDKDTLIKLFDLVRITIPEMRATLYHENGHVVMMLWHPRWRVMPLDKTVTHFFSTYPKYPVDHDNAEPIQQGYCLYWWRYNYDEESYYLLTKREFVGDVQNIEHMVQEYGEDSSVDSVLGQYLSDDNDDN